MLKDLVKLANDLDAKGLRKEADLLDSIIQKWAVEADENDGIINRLMTYIMNLGPELAGKLATKLLHKLESEDDFLKRKSNERAKRIKNYIDEGEDLAAQSLLSREGLDPEIDISGDKLEELRNQYNKKYEEIFERPAPSGSSE